MAEWQNASSRSLDDRFPRKLLNKRAALLPQTSIPGSSRYHNQHISTSLHLPTASHPANTCLRITRQVGRGCCHNDDYEAAVLAAPQDSPHTISDTSPPTKCSNHTIDNTLRPLILTRRVTKMDPTENMAGRREHLFQPASSPTCLLRARYTQAVHEASACTSHDGFDDGRRRGISSIPDRTGRSLGCRHIWENQGCYSWCSKRRTGRAGRRVCAGQSRG